MILSGNSGVVDTVRIKVIIGKRDYLVWDPDRNHSSGPSIHSLLQNLGYVGDYADAQFNSFEHLRNYKSLFICTGVAYENYVLFKDCNEVKMVVDFINQGGCVYLEGGECWAFDPFVMFGFNFNPYFGIKPISDGYTNMGPIEGVDNTFTQGMEFGYNGENFYLDVIDSTNTGFRVFHDQDDDYYCGVANVAVNYRTVGISFELSGLVDNERFTKADLLDSIMHFFGISLVGIEDLANSQYAIRNSQLLSVYPNPFRNHCIIKFQFAAHPPRSATPPGGLADQTNPKFQSPNNFKILLRIYDVSGRMVKDLSRLAVIPDLIRDQRSTVVWNGSDDCGRRLSPGIYFIRLEAGELAIAEKVILAR